MPKNMSMKNKIMTYIYVTVIIIVGALTVKAGLSQHSVVFRMWVELFLFITLTPIFFLVIYRKIQITSTRGGVICIFLGLVLIVLGNNFIYDVQDMWAYKNQETVIVTDYVDGIIIDSKEEVEGYVVNGEKLYLEKFIPTDGVKVGQRHRFFYLPNSKIIVNSYRLEKLNVIKEDLEKREVGIE